MVEVTQEYTWLVNYWVHKYAPYCKGCAVAGLDDIKQAGFLGLLEALTTYDAGKSEFSTWASYSVRKYIRDALGIHSGKTAPVIVSLDSPAYGDPECDVSLGDTIPDESIPEVDAAICADDMANAVRESVDALPDEQQAVIRGLFFDGMTRREVSENTGMSYDRVGHVRSGALLALSRDKSLRDSFADDVTFISKKSVSAFERDRTSDVEHLAMWMIRKSKKEDKNEHVQDFYCAP